MPRDVLDLISERTDEDTTAEFIRNPEPRGPVLLGGDTSHSMAGDPIAELNAGLALYPRLLADDPLAAKRAETAILTFGGSPVLAHDFATVQNLRIPHLTADGGTPMSAAILRGLDLLAERKRVYRENRITCYTPWFFLLTDGAPTDPELWPSAIEFVRRGEAKNEFVFFAIGVGEHADMKKLAELSVRPPARLHGNHFQEFFRWLAKSLVQKSQSMPGETIELAPISGWGSIKV